MKPVAQFLIVLVVKNHKNIVLLVLQIIILLVEFANPVPSNLIVANVGKAEFFALSVRLISILIIQEFVKLAVTSMNV